MKTAQGYIGDPINTRTGAYDYSVADVSISTNVGDLKFERTYGSFAVDFQTTLSPGWTHNHDARLILPSDPGGLPDRIQVKLHSANRYIFSIENDGTFTASPGICATLIQKTGSPYNYILTDSAQRTYTFNENGELLTYADAQGHSWTYTYYTNGKLDRINANGGSEYLDLEYDTQGRIVSVNDQTGRFVTYHYNANGDLDFVTDVLGQTWAYEYDAVLGHRLTRVAAPDNVTIEQTEYYSDGRAWKQFNGEGNLVAELIYHADGTTTIKDASNNSEAQIYDERGTLVSTINAEKSETFKVYDDNSAQLLPVIHWAMILVFSGAKMGLI